MTNFFLQMNLSRLVIYQMKMSICIELCGQATFKNAKASFLIYLIKF